MPRTEQPAVDVRDLVLADATGRDVRLGDPASAQVVVLMRHRHELPCQQHLVQVREEHERQGAAPRISLVLVGFSPARDALDLSGPEFLQALDDGTFDGVDPDAYPGLLDVLWRCLA